MYDQDHGLETTLLILTTKQSRSVAVARKADRTAYDVRYSCAWNSHGHTTRLPMAIPDAEISSAVRHFAVCCG